jgi:Ca-activated chloride channel homolog
VPIDLKPDPAGGYGRVLRRGDFSPERGLTLVFPEVRAPVALTQAHGDARYFVMDVPVTVESRRRALPARAALVWDSSHSGAGRSHDLEFALLDRYFAAARQVDVDLIRLRDTAEPARRFVVRDGDWAALRRELEATVYDGATSADFVVDPKAGDVLLFGDGLFNYGRGGFPTLASAQRLYAVQAAAGDGARLAALAHGQRGQLIRLEGRGQLEQAAAALLDDSTRLDSIDATGATDLAWESPVPVDGRLRIAGRLREADPRLQLRLSGPAGAKTLEVRLPAAVEGRMAGWLWARYSLARLQGDPGRHRAAMQQLGTEFSLVTPQTSLIVLERPEDYVRHAVPAPDDLRAEVAALMRERDRSAAQEKKSRLDKVADAWAERIAWWEMSFPKGKRPEAKVQAGFGPPPPPAPASVAAASAPSARRTAAPPAASSELDRVSVTGSRIRRADIEGEEEASPATRPASIRLQPWVPDSAVARRLRGGASEDVYRLYLDERSRAPQGTAFYLDVADILFEKKQPELALRVLSNLAEMQLEDRHILRVLAYRLLQAKRADLAVPLLERVREIGGEEPQSYRDLGLAYAELGDHQKAVEQLYEVVIRPWDTRFTDIEMASLAELNALVATAGQRLDTSRIDPRLMRNLPVGLRAVLSWDSDNSDMDLHVTDPNGEEAYYSNPLTYQGGRMSDDFTGGYGPEEFALREPAPGRYRIEVVYFGDQQQIVTGATTLQLWLSTGFGTRKQKDQKVTLRLADRKERIFVGEFEVHRLARSRCRPVGHPNPAVAHGRGGAPRDTGPVRAMPGASMDIDVGCGPEADIVSMRRRPRSMLRVAKGGRTSHERERPHRGGRSVQVPRGRAMDQPLRAFSRGTKTSRTALASSFGGSRPWSSRKSLKRWRSNFAPSASSVSARSCMICV